MVGRVFRAPGDAAGEGQTAGGPGWRATAIEAIRSASYVGMAVAAAQRSRRQANSQIKGGAGSETRLRSGSARLRPCMDSDGVVGEQAGAQRRTAGRVQIGGGRSTSTRRGVASGARRRLDAAKKLGGG